MSKDLSGAAAAALELAGTIVDNEAAGVCMENDGRMSLAAVDCGRDEIVSEEMSDLGDLGAPVIKGCAATAAKEGCLPDD
jgi:hypothetical protein